MTNNFVEYRQYMQSPHWLKFSAEARQHYKFRCYVCDGRGWQVHHLYYVKNGKSILFNEEMPDVRVLCKTHHLRGKMDLETLNRYRSNIRFRRVTRLAIFLPLDLMRKLGAWLRGK